MSLINDAIKRATQAQPPAPPAAETVPEFEPAEHASVSHTSSLYVSLALLGLLLGALFLVKGWQTASGPGSTQTVEARESQPIMDGGESAEAFPPIPMTERTNAEPEFRTASSVVRDFSVEQNSAHALAEGAMAAEVPVWRLQGIFFRPRRPSAMINTRLVYIGDQVQNAKVLAITRESVTLQVDGETKVLNLH